MNREPHFDENEVLRQCMSPLNEEVPDMPENFHAQWTALVKEDAMKQEETRKVAPMRRWTRILSVAAALVFVVGGTLLTKDSLSPARTSAPQSLSDSYDYDYDTYASDVGYSEEAGSGVRTMMVGAANDAMPEAASAKSAAAEDKKIIRNVSLTIKTSAYDDSMASLTALLSQYGGYLESSSEYTNNRDLRTAALTLRIPADSLDAFLSNTGELGRITSRNMSSTDVTASYQDTAARLENQKLLLARLQALTDTAGDLSDLLALESQGYTRYYDGAAKAAYWVGGENFVSGEDEQSIRDKAQWAVQQGLQGAAVWSYGQDDSGKLLAWLKDALEQ